MSNKAEGFVQKIFTKDDGGKAKRPWKLDNVLIADTSGEEIGWFGLGFRDDVSVAPKCVEGDYITFEWEADGQYKNIVKGTARIKKDAPAPAQSTVSAPSGGSSNSTQQNIHYQNSRTAAIEMVRVLLENNGLSITGTTSKAAQAKRYDEITAAVDKLTVQFYNDLDTFRLFETVDDAGAIDTSADGELPDQDEPAADTGDGEDEPV